MQKSQLTWETKALSYVKHSNWLSLAPYVSIILVVTIGFINSI